MKRNTLKKTLSYLLTVCMLLSVFAFSSVYAENTLTLKSSSALSFGETNGIKYVVGLAESKTVADLLSNFESANITVSKDGTALSNNSKVGTGAAITLGDEKVYVVVRGDTDGDGIVSSTDYLQIKSYFLRTYTLEGVYLVAANAEEGDGITATDYLRIKSYFLGSFMLYPEVSNDTSNDTTSEEESSEPETSKEESSEPDTSEEESSEPDTSEEVIPDSKENYAKGKSYTLSGKLTYISALSDDGVILTNGIIPNAETVGQTVAFSGTNAVNTIVIDLAKVYTDINEIVVGGVRVNGNRQYGNVVIEVSSTNSSYSVVSNYKVANTMTNSTGTYNYSYRFSSNIAARYVKITFTSSDYVLTIGEIEVYGGENIDDSEAIAPEEPFAEGSDIRVMSYNILHPEWGNVAIAGRDTNVANIIMYYMPDVVGLQEVNEEWHNSLKTVLVDKGIYYPACQKNNSNLYNMTTFLYNSRTVRLIEEYVIDLDQNSDIRVLSVAIFEKLSDGKRFVVTNNHPAPTGQAENYERNFADLIRLSTDLMGKYKDLPVIQTGDFNTKEQSDMYQKYMDQTGLKDAKYVADVLVRSYNTFCGLNKDPKKGNSNCIDHIFVNDKTSVKLFNVVIEHDVSKTSDHIPIYADIELK